jgi:hypothetical protein
MATVAVIAGAAIVNAVAFTAGNALYDKFGRGNSSGERERHDKAIENQQKAMADWSKKRAETLDWINTKVTEKNDARAEFDDVDRALEFYNETHPDGQIILPERPKLRDFYKPSSEQHYFEAFAATALGGLFGYLAFAFL